MRAILLTICLMSLLQGRASAHDQPVSTVSSVDLESYLGTWYEIAAIPQSFESQCTGNTTAQYAKAEDGLLSVVNSCDTEDGTRSVANGRAKVVDSATNAKLKVTFVNIFGWQFLFGGDYWIIGLGEKYSYAVVGAPGRDYAWILSRTPMMSSEQLSQAAQVLVQQGFDTCQLISSVQAMGLQAKTPLCQLVK